MSGTYDSGLDVTSLLRDWNAGRDGAEDRLLDAVYQELRVIASRRFRKERQKITFQPTDLVHEAYLKLIDQQRVTWQNRAHFFAMASQIMRRLLVDRARKRQASKRGGDLERITLETGQAFADRPTDLLALDDALQELAKLDPQRARLVELRFFAGLKFKEIAEITGQSLPTINRHWRATKAWLYRALRHAPTDA